MNKRLDMSEFERIRTEKEEKRIQISQNVVGNQLG
jgi:hypothetical protein